jgi:hypothetical protein
MSRGYLKKCANRNGTPKKAHPTQALAEVHRSAMIAMGKWTAANSNTYPCNQCGGYHAGSLGKGNRGKGRMTAKNPPRHLASQ